MSVTPSHAVTCAACGQSFLIPPAERAFRSERGLTDPLECPDCRRTLRAARNSDLMSLYQRSDALSFGESPRPPERAGGRSPSQSGGGRSKVANQRYNTVCAACGAETQVPFVPRGDRPVYCRDCFNARKGR